MIFVSSVFLVPLLVVPTYTVFFFRSIWPHTPHSNSFSLFSFSLSTFSILNQLPTSIHPLFSTAGRLYKSIVILIPINLPFNSPSFRIFHSRNSLNFKWVMVMGTPNLPFGLLLSLHLVSIKIIIMHGRVSEAMSTVTTMAKDQISCDECEPVYSPPPPLPPPPSPPPPSPKPYCPPPPSPKPYCPPPPPPTPKPYCPPPPSPPPPDPAPAKPPSGDGGGEGSGPTGSYYPPPSGNSGRYPLEPPPNPVVSYFPFYYPPPSDQSSSTTWRRNPTSVSSLITIILVSSVFYV